MRVYMNVSDQKSEVAQNYIKEKHTVQFYTNFICRITVLWQLKLCPAFNL